MGLNIISNFAANRALTNLTFTSGEATRSVAKLSSGSRVVTAADDAAALAIGSRLKAEVASLDQAVVNAGQATSLLQVAAGALARTQDILTRLKALAVQAGSQNLADAERALLDVEFQNLVDEIDRIAFDTEFNSKKLLTNQNANLVDQINAATGIFSEGGSANGVGNVTIRNFLNDQISAGGDGSFQFTQNAGQFTDTNFQINYGFLVTAAADQAGTSGNSTNNQIVLSASIDPGIVENAGQTTADLITGTALVFKAIDVPSPSGYGPPFDGTTGGITNTSIGETTLEEAEIVISLDESFNLSNVTHSLAIPGQPSASNAAAGQVFASYGAQNGTNAGSGTVNLNANSGLNAAARDSLSPTNNFIFKVGSGILPAEDNVSLGVPGITVENLGLTNSSILTNTLADSVSETLTQAIDFVVKVRADIGSSTNRLDFASRNIQTTIENTEAARSTLLDLDVAREITTFTSQQILVQAGISVLAQANQLPQNLLRLFA